MSSSNLTNYLRSWRKRTALTQRETAFLIGWEKGETLSRYERDARMPNLGTAMALEIILATSLKQLFPGQYTKIERDVGVRARRLLSSLETETLVTPTKRKLLLALISLCERG